ncbi:D-2-hydroxyacid dehydrogenase [Aquisphaera insulae]|uniref:D-2-hydroxyacid dehydrogenase n=1 Tax=Aquisphaera insulae TaxID=2712864 RepID=UPI0013EA95CE|nr:D-2-hydroxyacid dehydrogenase [Aquisphaera insulae]
MKIVILDGRTLAPERGAWAGLERLGEVIYHDVSTADQVLERAAGATVVATNKTPIREEALAGLPDLKFITVLATGFDCVDLKAARNRGIPVSNVPVYGTPTVAQYVFALLLELCHHVALHAQAVRDGEWTDQPDFSLRKTRLIELAGKTMGIVGYGRIGRRTAELASAFGMKVLAFDPTSTVESTEALRFCGLDELFAASDVISLHCPMTEQTAGLINRDRLAGVKPGAFLINTARGGLIVEEDLAEALNAGKLGAAALDVVSKEPIRPDNPLLKARNCLITPHIAWATDEARGRLMETTVANVEAFLRGKPINVVN